MDKAAGYEGYVIQASPYQLAEGGRWSTHLEISRVDGDLLTTMPYSAGNTHDSEEDAIKHSLNFGRKIIDGEVPGCSAP